MTNNEITHEGLSQALAINRMMEQLDKVESGVKSVSYNAGKRTDFLMGLLEDMHKQAYSDWRGRPEGLHAPGDIISIEKRAKLRAVLTQLGDPKNNHPLFDESGYILKYPPEEISEILAGFYRELQAVKPFDYGNELTLDFFMLALAEMPRFHRHYGAFDLRGMDEGDIKLLHDPAAGTDKLALAFRHALDSSLPPKLNNKKENSFPVSHTQEINIAGFNFLSCNDKQFGLCLVRVDGGLVPLTDEVREKLKNQMLSRRQFADLPPIGDKQVVGYVMDEEEKKRISDLRVLTKNDKGFEEGKTKYKEHIDGFKVSPDAAPLYCLDVNILTGLTTSRHNALVALMRDFNAKQKNANWSIFNLSLAAENPDGARKLAADLMEEAKDSPALQRSIQIAQEHLTRITHKLNEKKEQKFVREKDGEKIAITGVEKPTVILTMGGAGSGKSSADHLAQIQCGENYVTASLDAFRSDTDLYKLLEVTKHHGDDYTAVNPFAETLREWVADYARSKKINLLYDGSGIEFVPRYRDLMQTFEKDGYDTIIPASEREIGSAVNAIKERANEKKGRMMPWRAAIEKHVLFPRSFMSAVAEPSVKKIFVTVMDDTDPTHDYVMAEGFLVNNEQLSVLHGRQKQQLLAPEFKAMMQGHETSILKKMAGAQVRTSKGVKTLPDLDALIKRIPGFADDNTISSSEDSNVAYLVHPMGKGLSRVLAIYDVERFKKMMKKMTLNAEGNSKEQLQVVSEELRFLPGGSWEAAVSSPKSNGNGHTRL